MADYPLKELGGKTILEVAKTPNLDYLASHGLLGRVRTIPEGMDPGSDVAILSILGYDPRVSYPGRAPLEQAVLPLRGQALARRRSGGARLAALHPLHAAVRGRGGAVRGTDRGARGA